MIINLFIKHHAQIPQQIYAWNFDKMTQKVIIDNRKIYQQSQIFKYLKTLELIIWRNNIHSKYNCTFNS